MDTQNDGSEMAINYSFNTWPYSVSMLNFWGVSTAKGRQVTWHHHGQTMWWFSPQGIHRQQKSWEARCRFGVQPGLQLGEKVGKKNPMDSNSAGNGRGIWLLVPKGGYCIFCWMFFLLCCRQMTNMTMSYSLLLESWKSTQFQWTMFLDFDFQGMDILNITHDDIMMTPNTLLFPGCIWLGRKDEYLQPMGRFLPASTGSTRSTSATVLLYPPNKYSQNMV